MRKFYIVAMAFAVALSAFAFGPRKSVAPKMKAPARMAKSAKPAKRFKVSANAEEFLEFQKVQGEAAKYAKIAKPRFKEDEIQDAEEPLLEADGRSQIYKNQWQGFMSFFGQIFYDGSTSGTEIVWGEEGDVYLRDVVPTAPSGVYVKGTYADGKITVEFPQICYYEDYDGEYWCLYASVSELFSFEEDGMQYFSYKNCDADKQTVVYTVAEDGTISMDLNPGSDEDFPPYILALVEDTTPGENDWYGEGTDAQLLTEFNEVAPTVPEGVALEEWSYFGGSSYGKCKVGFAGDKVYILAYPDDENIVVEGNVVDGKVMIPKQYAGMSYGSFVYAMGVLWADESFEECEMLDQMPLNYNPEGKRISTDNPLIDFLYNMVDDDYEPAYVFENVSFFYQTEEQTNANPMDPQCVYFEPYGYVDYIGASEGYIEWDILPLNVNGCLLDTDNMYYNIYYNDELFTFTLDQFPYFDEEVTNIPFDFGDDFDLAVMSSLRYITFKSGDYWKFGCQSFYLGSDGVTYKSNLAEYIPDGVEQVAAAGFKELESVELFNLQGQRVVNPGPGLYIMRQHFTDGSSRSIKIAR